MSKQGQATMMRLSRGTRPSVHRYYDIPCESPDETRILYFEFDGKIPGPGTLVVADRDGGHAREVGRCEGACIGHVGAHATWLGNDTVWFGIHEHSGVTSRFVSLRDGSTRDARMRIRAYHEGTRLAALTVTNLEAVDGEFARRRCMRVDRLDVATGETLPLLTIEQAVAVHPLRDTIDPSQMNFMNTKWSPDGATLSVVFTDEIYRHTQGESRSVKGLILVNADGRTRA